MVIGFLGGNVVNSEVYVSKTLASSRGNSHHVELAPEDYIKTAKFDENQLYPEDMFITGWYCSIPPNGTFFGETNMKNHRGWQVHNDKSIVVVLFPERFFTKEYREFIKCFRLKDEYSNGYSKENWMECEINILDKSFTSFIEELETEYQTFEAIIHDEYTNRITLKESIAKWITFESDNKESLLRDFEKLIEERNRNEFKINEYIIVRLEEGKTNIYVKRRFFNQCKYLLLNIPVNKVSSFDEINSIDEAAEILDNSLEGMDPYEYDIEPEVEFWAHCSNLQVWAENKYNTRLLHSNLAFPLLKRLTEVGDLIAKRVFKEEIVKRIESNYEPVVHFLIEAGYLKHLNEDEIRFILENESINLKIKNYLENYLP